MRRLVPVERFKRRNGASDSAVPTRRVMTSALAAPDAPTLLVSLARNIAGVIYRCALDAHWTMHFIGDEIEGRRLMRGPGAISTTMTKKQGEAAWRARRLPRSRPSKPEP